MDCISLINYEGVPLSSLTLNFSGSPTKAGSVKSLLFFEDKEGSVLGRLISGDHKIGRIRSTAAESRRSNAEVNCLSFKFVLELLPLLAREAR